MTNSTETPTVPTITQEILDEIEEWLWTVKDKTPSGFSLAQEDEFIDSKRWFEVWARVFTDNKGNYWRYSREVPSTEMQEGSESAPLAKNVTRVQPTQVIITKYVPFVDNSGN